MMPIPIKIPKSQICKPTLAIKTLHAHIAYSSIGIFRNPAQAASWAIGAVCGIWYQHDLWCGCVLGVSAPAALSPTSLSLPSSFSFLEVRSAHLPMYSTLAPDCGVVQQALLVAPLPFLLPVPLSALRSFAPPAIKSIGS